MRIPKRHKARLLAEEERWKKLNALNPQPKPAPWTDGELSELNIMRSLLEKARYGQAQDIDSVLEFLRFGFYFKGHSQKFKQLANETDHYMRLERNADKLRVWNEIHPLLGDLQGELSALRRSRDRGGAIDQ